MMPAIQAIALLAQNIVHCQSAGHLVSRQYGVMGIHKAIHKTIGFFEFRLFLRQKAIQGAIQMNLKNVSRSRVESFNGIYWFSLNWNLCWSERVARKQQSKCFHRCSTFSFNWNRDI